MRADCYSCFGFAVLQVSPTNASEEVAHYDVCP